MGLLLLRSTSFTIVSDPHWRNFRRIENSMGIIKDGSVSGRLPSAEAFAVHYPGYPSSTSRAVETLGGIDAIAKTRSSKLNKLELRFRPEDPYSHPAFGQLYPCNNFILRICRRKCSDDQSDDFVSKPSRCHSSESNSCDSKPGNLVETHPAVAREGDVAAQTVNSQTPGDIITNLSADLIARVRESYHFNGMVDYQHVLAVHADAGRRKRKSWAEVEGPATEKGDLGNLGNDNLMILVPQLFSLKDIPENLVLRPSATLSSKKKQEGVLQHRWEMEIEPSLAIDFNIKDILITFIQIPRKVNWEQFIPKESDQWNWQTAVSKLFDERPIWPKISISERLRDMGGKCADNLLRRLLFRSAYYFGNGPFQRLWIRKGYDPRKDPESRIYQRIDFRVPPPLRGYCNTANGLEHRWEDVCAFRVFPYKCQIYLQLYELHDDYIQQEIQKPPTQTVCTCPTGWFSSYLLDSLRLRVALRFLSIYPQAEAESLLKSVSERFEKSKRMHFQTNFRLDEEAESQVHGEPTGIEDKAESSNDDEEENEIDGDDGEEDMDVYHPSHLAAEETDYSLQTDSYLDGLNISRSYLQELFGSFPMADSGASHLSKDADSHGEYQIYEQDSDDNNSDDDYY
ncbi:hypothetical protein Nepgr_031536 [Nepenthes gracilis]|uniref:Uncharacterized protein n=1 Tax=Nepenthes gracilis TaxID=150966 RepID=A0AAD3TIN9_NEPGR|nr:hypothetical protein Nepgr_031536 [Nepenthes gracilis]